ncbi:FAS1-like dehydratase domain-containing protein [Nocardioides caldifontis]|uniref:FAS1-like dehydratase domain-containing protein n=1 Tax=Nocardioides caldifontis TaxID=2588938 RepID=UPI0011E00266|nr:MaoC family dehydratase N-terminal domain-containing protein [Nocardioides caldifontis]
MRGSRIEEVHTAACAAVGTTTRTSLGEVHPRELGRYSVAVTGSLPGHAGDLAEPLFLSSVLAWGDGPEEQDLLPDGNAADPFAGFDVAGLRLMGGGQRLTFHRDLVPGKPITVDVTLASVDLKEVASGKLLVLVVERCYTDADGLLLECSETFLGREALV